MSDICVKCGCDVRGAFETKNVHTSGGLIVVVDRTPDNDHIVCDMCNDVWHMDCCADWETGYCDRCLVDLELMDRDECDLVPF